MITEQQITEAAQDYTYAMEKRAFVDGAFWAIEQISEANANNVAKSAAIIEELKHRLSVLQDERDALWSAIQEVLDEIPAGSNVFFLNYIREIAEKARRK